MRIFHSTSGVPRGPLRRGSYRLTVRDTGIPAMVRAVQPNGWRPVAPFRPAPQLTAGFPGGSVTGNGKPVDRTGLPGQASSDR
jgi:hypothetical protein